MDANAIWQNFKDEWTAKRSPPMDEQTFNVLFADEDISREAIKLIRNSRHARKTVEEATAGFGEGIVSGLWDDERLAVWAEVRARDEVEQFIASGRTRNNSVATRARLLETIVAAAVKLYGREWARGRIHAWWNAANLLEEERDSLLEALAKAQVLHSTLLNHLGVEAIATVRRLIARDAIDERLIEPFAAAALSSVQGTHPANPLGPRIGALLQDAV